MLSTVSVTPHGRRLLPFPDDNRTLSVIARHQNYDVIGTTLGAAPGLALTGSGRDRHYAHGADVGLLTVWKHDSNATVIWRSGPLASLYRTYRGAPWAV
ncbi:hypothetical protein ACOMHN_009261 [Nucella lapillus]